MILPEKNFGRLLSRLMVLSTDGDSYPVPTNEDGVYAKFVPFWLVINNFLLFYDFRV